MKTLTSFLLTLSTALSLPAFATTQAFFAADQSRATILVMGMNGDDDAANLYAVLTAPEEVIDGKRTKRLIFDNEGGGRLFSVICVMSAFAAANGSCTVIINAAEGTSIDKNAAEAHFLSVGAADLARLQSAFVLPADSNLIYASRDRKLQFSVTRFEGRLQSFELLYR